MIKDKEYTLKITTDEIEKKFGKGAIMRLGESTALNVEAIPTGALPLDVALGIGGVPRGRIVEIYGPESSGKTTVALHIIAEAQAAGGIVAFIDAEHALDPVYAARLGVDVDDLHIYSLTLGEHVLGLADAAVSDLGNVDQAVHAGQNLSEGTEGHQLDDLGVHNVTQVFRG